MRKKLRINYRIISLFMAIVILLTSTSVASSLIPIVAAAGSNVNLEDALHFYIRHWHTMVDDEALYQGDSNSDSDGEKDRYFVLVEGYIVPLRDADDEIYSHEFYMVKQDTGDLVKYGDGIGEDEMDITTSPYIESLNEEEGIIVLKKKPLMDGDEAIETFAGLAISSGRSAVTEIEKTDSIQIKYDEYVHLVKGHAFYTPAQMIVDGATATTVDGDAVSFDNLFDDPEIDTAWVYTYIKETTVSGKTYKEGAIVMSSSDPDQPCVSADDLPAGVPEENVQLSKFYSTVSGMHTDRTIEVIDNGNGRTFASTLEAWYTQGHAPEVGMVFDASGSMVSAIDTPSKIHYTDDELDALGITKLEKENGDPSETGGWDQYFLTDSQLNKILNPRNTDNSTLGVSGYNYFVYEPYSGSGTDYVPLAYWEGAGAKKAGTKINFVQSDDDVIDNWPSGHTDLNMATANGFHISGTLNGSTDESTNGIVLDAKPSGKNFTVSFNLIMPTSSSTDPTDKSSINIAELLYIGPMSGSMKDGNYYRLIRDEGNSASRLRANQSPDRNNWVTDFNSVFTGQGLTYRVTLVFSDDTVTSYLNGNSDDSNTNVSCKLSDDINIIINGIEDSYNGTPIYIDDIYVFNTALEAAQVSNTGNWANSGDLIGLYKFENPSPRPDGTSTGNTRYWLYNSIYGGSNDMNKAHYASKLTGQLKITNNSNTVSVPTVASTWSGKVFGAINTGSGDWLSNKNNPVYTFTQGGWYVISHSGNFANAYAATGLLTAKRLFGINGGYYYNNGAGRTVNSVKYDGVEVKDVVSKLEKDSSGEYAVSSSDTGYKYKATVDVSTRFYFDEEGCLRCFYGSSNTDAYCSYVFELTDEQYVRTEALRRAVGLFITDLNSNSPASKVSGVRFSTTEFVATTNNNFDAFKNLVLQDWTDDPEEGVGMLSVNRGNGGSTDFETSANGVNQYNYGLTGGTSTWRGLQAYINELAGTVMEDESNKYLIIFTDGADSERTSNSSVVLQYYDENGDLIVDTKKVAKDAAKTLADSLKDNLGYTIFTVLLDSESMRGESYSTAETFLKELAGKKGLSDEENARYFYSIQLSIKSDLANEQFGDDEKYQEIIQKSKTGKLTYADLSDEDKKIIDAAYDALDYSDLETNPTDILTNVFTEEVLKEIISPLEGYTVKDYIDPRFDLQVSATNETVWHLNAGGQIVIGNGTGENSTFYVNSTSTTTFHLYNTTTGARDPFLRYDAEEDMYYFEWVNQTIPTSAEGADRLAIWDAQVILKAKDDFIGGNDILTCGNKENMNWVYHPGDLKSEKDKPESERAYKNDPNFPFGYDASSGTDDCTQDFTYTYDDDGNLLSAVINDAYPSKGFPRTVANVQLLPLNTKPLNDVIYEGELVSHAEILTNIEDEYVTDSYYLEYLRRYAYQRYLYVFESKKEEESKTPKNAARIAMFAAESEELEEDLNKPLIELLNDWLGIKDDNKLDKSFSVPYMYLPSVSHNDDGTIKLGSEGYAEEILNNYGDLATHGTDVIGILTYRWHQIEPGSVDDEIKNYVKDSTEQNRYSLTVEFTPLKKGDTLKDSYYLTPSGERYCYDEDNDNWYAFGDDTKTPLVPQPTEDEVKKYQYYPSLRSYIDVDGRDHIFAHYLPIDGIDGNKSEFTGENDDFEGLGFDFDRAEAYVNGNLITDENYKWNSDYKPARNEWPYHAGDLQPFEEASNPNKYGNTSRFINHGRTLESQSAYTQEVVSGGFVLELKMLIGELAEWLGSDKLENLDNSTTYTSQLKLKATRTFTDTDFAEALKAENEYDDYGEDFIFTFTLEYTGEKLKQLARDNDGYVSVYAQAETIEGTFGDASIEIDELPIGTYQFELAYANSNDAALKNKLHFSEISYEEDNDKFADAYKYFNELVLNGLNTTNEKPEQKWKVIEKEDGTKETLSTPEILESNIEDFIAEAKSDKTSATFYIGTSSTDPDSHRGNTDDTEKLYTDYRLGIIRLSTGTTRLTVAEKGAQDNESFLYHITGTTLGGKEVDLIISVEGNGETTIDILPGNYTVTEIYNEDNSNWSWRYVNKDTYDTLRENGTDDEKYTREAGDWDVTTSDFRSAYTELRYRDDEPEVLEHHYVTFEHERNGKNWLGSEKHKNNQFTFPDTETE